MKRPGPLWAAAGTGIQVGAAMVATRYVVDAAGPGSLGFLRYLVGLVCLAPALGLRPWQRIAARDLLPIGLLGIGQFAALMVLLNYSLLHIPAARASLLFSTFPLMTMILSALLGRERPQRAWLERRSLGAARAARGGRCAADLVADLGAPGPAVDAVAGAQEVHGVARRTRHEREGGGAVRAAAGVGLGGGAAARAVEGSRRHPRSLVRPRSA